jgi:hypothetical protein
MLKPLSEITSYITEAISTPLLSSDPVFQGLTVADATTKLSGIDRIIKYICEASEYDITVSGDVTFIDVPTNEMQFLVLLVKKEIYERLATAFAAEWNVETEFTKLLKSDRFTHYSKLLTYVQKEITQAVNSGKFGSIQVGELVTQGRDGTLRNYNLANAQTADLKSANITATSVELTWSDFDSRISRFAYYDLYVSRVNPYDPYSDPVLDVNVAENRYRFTDITRTKYRLTNLLPATTYYIVILYRSANGREDMNCINFTTLSS